MKSLIKLFLFFSLCLLTTSSIEAQTGVIKGRISNKLNNEPLPFATVQVIGTTKGAQTDEEGNYEITGLEAKLYSLKIGFVGFKDIQVFEIQVLNSKPTLLDFQMEENTADLKEVVIKASPFRKTEESPVSLRTIGVTEIARNPGGNRDISKVIQSLPGVTATPAFRNDLIIRGGAPNENRFYLDDMEVPNINHFATQGASGGPVGMLNVTFIKEVDFFSGAFPANRGNAMSSVFNFRQREGATDKWRFTANMGASDVGLTAEGPLSKKTSFLFSARHSYLQFLFSALDLPFLPTYTDAQMKIKHKVNDKNEITYLFLGALDQFKLALDNRNTESNAYILDNLPVTPQWNYSNGVVWKRFNNTGYWTFVASRSMLDNKAYKYKNNDETLPKIFDYESQEIENKLRAERTTRLGKWKFLYGVNYEFAKYNNFTFQQRNIVDSVITINYKSDFTMSKYGGFAQVSRQLADDRLTLSGGFRIDGNSYNAEMKNPLNQFSPRFSLAYALTPQLSFNFNTGIYYQLPPYTTLGFKQDNIFVNQDRLKYIQNSQLVGGFEYNTKFDAKFSIEGYFKRYKNYPFLLRDQITLANLGADFGAIGNDAADSRSKGQTYGIEFLYQQRLYKGFYGILAYTYGRSEFEDRNGNLVPSAWDSKHILIATLGYQFKKNWEVGIKYRASTGLPYTPDAPESNIVALWNVNGKALPDYTQLNTLRTNGFNTFDFRVDKKWFGKKVTWNLYFDIQNMLGAAVSTPQTILDRPLDADLKPIGDAPTYRDSKGILRYKTKVIENSVGTTVPSFGVQVDF
ncbi:MAG: TonB-dependent receptor [Saprospiraceae bacterium]|nr:TonB-dependent receptor [Saprospiraceae bacterium]